MRRFWRKKGEKVEDEDSVNEVEYDVGNEDSVKEVKEDEEDKDFVKEVEDK